MLQKSQTWKTSSKGINAIIGKSKRKVFSLLIIWCLIISGMSIIFLSEEVVGSEDPTTIELVWDNAPFSNILILTEFNGRIYTAGSFDEKIYHSIDGDNWSPAFSTETTYSWRNSIIFKNDLYFFSVEDTDPRTAVIWKTIDGLTT